jgi:hypothetical protein
VSYSDLLADSPQATIFCQPWWLDAVAPGRHEVITVGKDGMTEAAWPLVDQPSRSGRVFGMPPLTPWLGILFSQHGTSSQPSRLAREKRLIEELADKLPRFGTMQSLFHPSFDYWLPLSWKGFSQTTWYSHALTDLSSLESVWTGFEKNTRTAIRKAEGLGIEVEASSTVDDFWKLHQMAFTRQGMRAPYGRELLERIDDVCDARECRRILLARAPDGTVHAGAYIVWDEKSAYYLLGGGHPQHRASGAGALVVWEAIKWASEVTRAFDLEGSSVEGIERFFRSFGGFPRPYYEITRVDSKLRRWVNAGRAALS